MGLWLEFKALKVSRGDLDTKGTIQPMSTTTHHQLIPALSLPVLPAGGPETQGSWPPTQVSWLEGEKVLCFLDPKMIMITK